MSAREIIDALRYQIVCWHVSTWGACANGCGKSSRGSQVCGCCLVENLSATVGLPLALNVVTAMRVHQASGAALEDAIQAATDGDL